MGCGNRRSRSHHRCGTNELGGARARPEWFNHYYARQRTRLAHCGSIASNHRILAEAGIYTGDCVATFGVRPDYERLNMAFILLLAQPRSAKQSYRTV